MNDKELATILYAAHAQSRKLRTRFSELNSTEKEHWVRVAGAAIRWFREEDDEFEPVSPGSNSQW